MKKSTEIALRMSKARESALRSMAATEAEGAETRAHSDAMAKLEVEYREALEAEAVEPEPEIRELSDRVELRSYLQSYTNGAKIEGREAELNKELGLDDVTHIPLAALEPRIEVRADAVTAPGDSTHGVDQRNIVSRVFKLTACSWAGFDMPRVPTGEVTWPVITGGDDGNTRAKGTAKDAVAATFEAVNVEPTRLTARYLWNVEDAALLRGLEDSLRSDLSMALGVLLDAQVLNGDGSTTSNAQNFDGLLGELTPQTETTNPSSEFTYSEFLTEVNGAVDGEYLRTVRGAKMIFSPSFYAKAASTFANSGKGDISAIKTAEEMGASFFASANMPGAGTPAATIASAIRISGPVAAMNVAVPVWEGISIIRDPYSSAASGRVSLTAIMLAGLGFKRTGGLSRVKLKIS